MQDQKDAIDKEISDLEQQWRNQDATNKLADLQNQLAQVGSSSSGWHSGMTVSNSHGTYTIPSGLSDSMAAAYAAAIQAGGVPLSAAKMATGGYVPPGKEGFAYLHENEVVINSDLTNRLREVLYNVPKLSVPSVSSHSITQTFHIDKLEFPNVRTTADAEGFAKQIGGIFKQAYFNARAGAMS